MMIHRAILAGGRSTRFGSNKAVFRYQDLSLISITILEMLKIRENTSPIIVSIHDVMQEREIFSTIQKDLDLNKTTDGGSLIVEKNGSHSPVPIIPVHDLNGILDKGARASIVGLFSIFKHVATGPVQVVPCDTPFFTSEAMKVMAGAFFAREDEVDAIIPRWANGFIEPLHGIFRVEKFIHILDTNMLAGELRLRKLLETGVNVVYLDIETSFVNVDPALRIFENINEKARLP